MKNVDGAYAIIRYDFYKLPNDSIPQDYFTVKEIVWTMEEAESETDRLNLLRNDSSTTRYFWQYTRVKKR